MNKKELINICKFYDKYKFLPDEKKKGIKILNGYIMELKKVITHQENIRYFKEKIEDYQKLKEKLQKELKK